MDYKYFVRGKFDIKLILDSFFFETDTNFVTIHGYKIAKIMAHDLLQVYIEDKILAMDNKAPKKSQHNPNTKLTWTSSKVALTELVYALHSEGVFNNGATDLKDIAEYFEHIFEINLGQYRRTFLEVRVRKGERTKFINSLKDGLVKRMDNTDDIV